MAGSNRSRPPLDRRGFLTAAGAGMAGLVPLSCSAPKPAVEVEPVKQPVIVLRSGWQTESIGDIAHTLGMLRLLHENVPEAKVILWSNAVDRGVNAVILRNFPHVKIVQGKTGENGEPDSAPLREAFETGDFLLHGSGPSVVAKRHLESWRKQTGKPYGIFGVTITLETEAASQALNPDLKKLLDGAEFVFTRETKSLENLKTAGVAGPELGFAPDATFSLKVSNEEAAGLFLTKYELEFKKFIAVVPRLRYTPYHRFRKVNWSEEKIRQRMLVSKRHAEKDHAKLRAAIVRWVRETGNKVLLCPEMTYQVEIIDPLLYLPLPADVKRKVVRRLRYWLTDEAASTYRRAAALLSFECHSPIIAAANDTPGIYVHQPEDGIKGQMWNDVGLRRWHLEAEETTGERVADAVMDIHDNYASSQVDAHEAVVYARKLQADAMALLRELVTA